jgi:hypothetical protein
MQLQQQMAQAPPQPQQPQPGQTPQPDPKQELQKQFQAQLQELQNLPQEPTIDQVLKFLKDNRAKSFVLDIETDSTIMPDEQREKQQRTEFITAMSGMLQQMAQMVAAAPEAATFCGEVLKFSLAPYRVGRTMDGAIDDMIEQAQSKAGQAKGDDPTTAAGKIALQIEQMKQITAKEKNNQDAALKAAELKQKDTHKQWELQNEIKIKQAELQAKMHDGEGKIAVQNQKAATDREAHQMHIIEKTQDMDLARQKAQMAMQTASQQAVAKQNDMAARAHERQVAAMNKPTIPRGR